MNRPLTALRKLALPKPIAVWCLTSHPDKQ